MVNDYYDMMHQTREKVKQHAEENGYPAPSSTLTPIFASLVTRHKLSIIMGEIDKMIDRLFVLNDALDNAIEENNLVAVVWIKTRLDEEKAKLRSYERLLDKESPVRKKPENGITDEMIQRAKEYPMEELLEQYGYQVKLHRTRCPVHGGKNPTSFSIKDNRGVCHCGWHGDTIALLIELKGCSFVEAVKRLQ
ncbi:MAG: DNA primase [Syntrophorhabdus sp. PtaU1.Bin153]|nr:MAG: DNA primase [Syntrophorhabdus sp. PtaU1.Bin153]